MGDFRETRAALMLGMRSLPFPRITFRPKKTDQFQIDGPVTLISKWTSATAREKKRRGLGLLHVVGLDSARRQVAGFIFGVEKTEDPTIIDVVTML